MLRLDQIYFRRFLSLFITVFLLFAFFSYFFLQKIEIDNYKTMLSHMIDELILSKENCSDFKGLMKKIHQKSEVRITKIDRNGTVIFDSNANSHNMNNHLNRSEIQEAIKEKYGSSVRYSHTLKINFLYMAKKTDDGFIRMAYPLIDIKKDFVHFWLKSIAFLAFGILILFMIALRMGKRVKEDLDHVKNSLERLNENRYDISFKKSYSKEFDEIATKIEKVAKKLKKREQQKRKYTKKLKNITKKQSDIISAISHEFKNPVAAISGYAQTLKDDSSIDPATKERFLSKILNNAQKISYMIDRLSMAIKLEHESALPKIDTFRMDLLVQEVVENIKQNHKNRQIILTTKEVKVNADKTMFENLFINLIENALKYSEDDVIVKITKNKVEVIDKGIGIPKKEIKLITNKFYRVNSLSWNNSIGVGLYIVKYILRLHKLELKIDSLEGEGSKFWFKIDKVVV